MYYACILYYTIFITKSSSYLENHQRNIFFPIILLLVKVCFHDKWDKNSKRGLQQWMWDVFVWTWRLWSLPFSLPLNPATTVLWTPSSRYQKPETSLLCCQFYFLLLNLLDTKRETTESNKQKHLIKGPNSWQFKRIQWKNWIQNQIVLLRSLLTQVGVCSALGPLLLSQFRKSAQTKQKLLLNIFVFT